MDYEKCVHEKYNIMYTQQKAYIQNTVSTTSLVLHFTLNFFNIWPHSRLIEQKFELSVSYFNKHRGQMSNNILMQRTVFHCLVALRPLSGKNMFYLDLNYGNFLLKNVHLNYNEKN